SGASTLYKGSHKRVLAIQLISALLFYFMLAACFVLYPNLWYIPLSMYSVRLLSQFLVFNRIYTNLVVRDLLIGFRFMNILYYFYICFNGLFNRRKKQTSW